MEKLLISIIILLSWFTLPKILKYFQPTAGLLDAGIWQLILLTVICFAGLLFSCWWLLYRFWHRLGLIELTQMVLQFNTLTLWQQIGLYWASFALLLLTAVGCLVAVL